MTTLSLNNRNDDLIELNKDSFTKSPLSFNIPNKQNRIRTSNFRNDDMLFNRNKISSDVVSMSSRSSSRTSSVDGDGDDRKKFMKKMNVYKKQYSDNNDDSESSSSRISDVSKLKQNNAVKSETSSVSGDDSSEGSEGSEGSRSGGSNSSSESDNTSSSNSKIVKKKSSDPRQRLMNELNEKREIIYQIDRLESKGFKIPFKFNMNSDIEEMRHEYHRIVKEKELDASVRFQQKMLMAIVSGTEYLNNRYDPFAIKLDGWSEQINENMNDYDDIFEELHQKYKSSGKKMAPEMRLFVSLSGSAFMFHLTSRMFKEQPLPDVENVLKSDPELMKHFQNAAAKQYIIGNNSQTPQFSSIKQQNDGSMGLFNMVSNLFGSLGGPSDSRISSAGITDFNKKPVDDIDNIIKNVHNKISFDNMDTNIETLSVSDEEITSIIEDTADIKILRGTKGRGNARTLNL